MHWNMELPALIWMDPTSLNMCWDIFKKTTRLQKDLHTDWYSGIRQELILD